MKGNVLKEFWNLWHAPGIDFRFRELKLQHKEEYLCVKAMILLNSSK